MTDQERLAFIEDIAKYVQKYAPMYGICVNSPIIAQACLESSYGTSNKAQYHNYFGLKYRENRVECASGYFSDTSSEQNADGTYTQITTNWFKFDTRESGVEGYFQFTNISNYSNLKGVTDPRTYLENIKADGYATSINYVDNVMRVVDTWNLTQYDTPTSSRNIKIAIDAGHGSETAGKRHPDGYREHYSDTYMAFYLNQILVKNGFTTFKSAWDDDNPTDDADIGLSTRQSQIKSFGADISVSIHANAHGDGNDYTSASGVSTHYHSDSSKVGDSVTLATVIQNELIKNTTQNNRGIVAQDLAMCNCTALGTRASVLCETAFMTNEVESALLKSDEFCIEVAREIAQGIFNYYQITDADPNVAVVLADRSNTDETVTPTEKNLKDAEVTLDLTVVDYYGDINCPTPSVSYAGISLIMNTDYTVKYTDNINAGTGKCTVTGKGKYTGSKTVEFTINPRDISSGTWIYTLNGDNCVDVDDLNIKCIGFDLVKDTDYELEVEYIDTDEYKVAICNAHGIGNYTGTLNGGFNVERIDTGETIVDITLLDFVATGLEFVYDGQPHKPVISNLNDLVQDRDYTVNYYGDFINVGKYTTDVIGIGEYNGKITYTTTITQKSIIDEEFTYIKSMSYNGLGLKPVVTSSNGLIEDQDFTVSYSNNINVGIGKISITGIGNYKDTKEYTFEITAMDITNMKASLEKTTYKYTGSEITPKMYVSELDEGTEYKVTYLDNIEVGKASAIAQGINNFTGMITLFFEICNLSIEDTNPRLSKTSYVYNGEEHCPEVIFNAYLVENKDYTIRYENNIDAGNAKVIIEGLDLYSGYVELDFVITRANISDRKIELEAYEYYYDGSYITPEFPMENLERNYDYYTTYSNNLNPGTAKITVEGINNYIGTISTTFEIKYTEIKNCIAKLGTASANTVYRIDGPFYVYANQEKYDKGLAMILNTDYSILSEKRVDKTDYVEVAIKIKGNGGFIGEAEHVYKVISKDPGPKDYQDDGLYNFGFLDIEGSETAQGMYDFGCLDHGVDPENIADGDYNFDKMSGMYLDEFDEDYDAPEKTDENPYGFTEGDTYTLNKPLNIYAGYKAIESSFEFKGTVYIYNVRTINDRVRLARIEDAVGSPARILGWVNAKELLASEHIPVGEQVYITGKIYENSDGTGSYIQKAKAVVYIKEFDEKFYTESETITHPYLVSNAKLGKGIGYAKEEDLTLIEN